MTKMIDIAKDFSPYPAGRYHDDGPFSGEKFRDEYLRPVLESGEKAVINLDGARGYGSSFLEEAFGGLVRAGFSPERVKDTFIFKTADDSLIFEIEDYIEHGNEPDSGMSLSS